MYDDEPVPYRRSLHKIYPQTIDLDVEWHFWALRIYSRELVQILIVRQDIADLVPSL